MWKLIELAEDVVSCCRKSSTVEGGVEQRGFGWDLKDFIVLSLAAHQVGQNEA